MLVLSPLSPFHLAQARSSASSLSLARTSSSPLPEDDSRAPFLWLKPPPLPYLMDSGTPFFLTFNATTTETNSTSGRG